MSARTADAHDERPIWGHILLAVDIDVRVETQSPIRHLPQATIYELQFGHGQEMATNKFNFKATMGVE